MKLYREILNELNKLNKSIDYLSDAKEYSLIFDYAKLIMQFGRDIDSKGIKSVEDLEYLTEIMREDVILFSIIVKDNLELLIVEYENVCELLDNTQLNIKQFSHGELKLAAKRKGDSAVIIIHEDFNLINEVNENLENDTEGIVLIGYGTGEVYSYLKKNYKVVVIDNYMSSVNNRNIDNIVMINQNLTKNDEEIFLKRKLIEFVGLKNQVILHPLYKTDESVIELMKLTKLALNSNLIDLNTRMLYTKNWNDQSIRNLIDLNSKQNKIVNIEKMKNRYFDKDAIVVAGGPSLDSAISDLKILQKSHYIIAIGQTVKVLIENNIDPDYIVSIDTNEANAIFFDQLKLDIPLVCSMQVNNRVLDSFNGPIIPYADNNFNKILLPYLNNVFPSASTVAISAVIFSYFLGFKKIGLVGQDLALINDNYYSKSVKNHSKRPEQLSDVTYDILLNNGTVGRTTPVLLSFIDEYNKLIKSFDGISSRLYNVSKFGAKINDVEYIEINKVKQHSLKNKLKFYEEDFVSKQSLNQGHQKITLELIKSNKSLEKKLKKIKNIYINNSIDKNKYDKIFSHWDSLISNESLKKFALPLQISSILIIQNKSDFYSKYGFTSPDNRKDLIDSIIKVIENIIYENKKYLIILNDH